jgi:hypothetical protein
MQIRRSLAISLGVTIALPLVVAPAALGSSHESEPAKYCSEQGGQVLELKPYLFPDSDAQVELGGSLHVCQFLGQGDDLTQIIVDLTTLHSERPTLAGLAYLSKVPSSDSGPAGSNPATSYCPDDLGGTEQFGTAAAGAWVGEFDPGMEAGYTDPLGDTVNLCVFADRSAIDDWGLLYASQGTVRGIDLSAVMRYQPEGDMPEVFATDD